jgi:5-methylcytosine-specific restriction endonuclease McrA
MSRLGLILRAAPHQWGRGKIHMLATDGGAGHQYVTRCGKTADDCPGTIATAPLDEVDCKVCLRSEAAVQRQAQWQVEVREREREQAAAQAAWWAAYNRYLASAVWQRKRQLVMARCGGMCEGCASWPATQVHHLRYPRSEPGSAAWIRQEMLFDLVAVCEDCHRDIHGRDVGR